MYALKLSEPLKTQSDKMTIVILQKLEMELQLEYIQIGAHKNRESTS